MGKPNKPVKCPRCGGFSRPIVCLLCDHEYGKDPGQHGYVGKALAAAYLLLLEDVAFPTLNEIQNVRLEVTGNVHRFGSTERRFIDGK